MSGYEVLRFFVREHARFGNEPQTERDLEREARAAAFDDVDREFGVLPEFKLVLRHVEIAAFDLAEPDVGRADNELAFRITHRRRPIATSAGLMKHQRAVLRAELVDDFSRFVGDLYSLDRSQVLAPDRTADTKSALDLGLMFFRDTDKEAQGLVHRFRIWKYLRNIDIEQDRVILHEPTAFSDLSDFQSGEIVFSFDFVIQIFRAHMFCALAGLIPGH